MNPLKIYFEKCPTAFNYIRNKLSKNSIIFDHYAIRSLDRKYYNSQKFCTKYGTNEYNKMPDTYNFPKHSVNANWYKKNSSKIITTNTDNFHDLKNIPRIFTSWHIVNEVHKGLPLFFFEKSRYQDDKHNNISHDKPNISYNEYDDLQNHNQYIAWTYLFKDNINHVAVEVDDIELETEKLIKQGIKFNDEGGIYKISDDKLLIQTSTKADVIKFNFNDRIEYVPYSFIEFVQRKYDPKTGEKREGFETQNADKIFLSTKK